MPVIVVVCWAAVRQALVNLEAVPAPAGPMTVVLGPGWPGILLAHVFLNAPFVARVYLNTLTAVPAEHWRLPRQSWAARCLPHALPEARHLGCHVL